MSNDKVDQSNRYQTYQVLLMIFSFIFFFVIAYGYYHLVIRAGIFPALVAGFVMATLAWYLARAVGTSPSGIRGNWVLLVPLFIISAAGVYNSLMLYLEGGQILADAASESQEQFSVLQTTAESAMASSGSTAKTARVQSLAESLFSEIRNPLNCGQGQEARRLLASLQQELPGFTALTNPGRDCSRNDAVIADYRERIAALIQRAPWHNPDLTEVIRESVASRQALGEARTAATTGYTPDTLQRYVGTFEELDTKYRELRYKLGRHAQVRSIPEGLHVSEIQSLGNAFKLPALFFERLDEWATYIYLGIAIGFDLFMVYLFQLVTRNRVRRFTTENDLPGVW